MATETRVCSAKRLDKGSRREKFTMCMYNLFLFLEAPGQRNYKMKVFKWISRQTLHDMAVGRVLKKSIPTVLKSRVNLFYINSIVL